jgi:hypothetical protein
VDDSESAAGERWPRVKVDFDLRIAVAFAAAMFVTVGAGAFGYRWWKRRDIVQLRRENPAYLEKLMRKGHYGAVPNVSLGPYEDTRL